MSQNDGFTSGFLAGALVGSVLGGLIGALVATKGSQNEASQQDTLLDENETASEDHTQSIEVARRSLEGKIAQLNLAIDDVRQQLGAVNGKTNPSSMKKKPELEEE